MCKHTDDRVHISGVYNTIVPCTYKIGYTPKRIPRHPFTHCVTGVLYSSGMCTPSPNDLHVCRQFWWTANLGCEPNCQCTCSWVTVHFLVVFPIIYVQNVVYNLWCLLNHLRTQTWCIVHPWHVYPIIHVHKTLCTVHIWGMFPIIHVDGTLCTLNPNNVYTIIHVHTLVFCTSLGGVHSHPHVHGTWC